MEQEKEFCFKISIWNFIEDIDESIFAPNGYMDQLTRNTGNLQINFEEAFIRIYHYEHLQI